MNVGDMKATRPSPCHSKVGSCLYRPVHLHGFGLPRADLHLAFCRPQKLTASCKSCSAEPRWAMSKLSWRPSPGSQGRAGELPALLPGECDILNAKGDKKVSVISPSQSHVHHFGGPSHTFLATLESSVSHSLVDGSSDGDLTQSPCEHRLTFGIGGRT